MRGVKIHGFTTDEIATTPGGLETLVQQRFDAAMSAPVDPATWNVKNKRWGEIWYTITNLYPYQVIAGLEGCLDGVVIGTWAAYESEQMGRYAEDFADGKVFAFENGAQWQAYVRLANSKRKFDTSKFQALISRGRAHGLTSEGVMVPLTISKSNTQQKEVRQGHESFSHILGKTLGPPLLHRVHLLAEELARARGPGYPSRR